MKIIILGATGMLGSDIVSSLKKSGHDCHSFNTSTINICDKISVHTALSTCTDADFLINCAAYTQVDLCEKEHSLAFSVNGTGPKNLAIWCREHMIPILHFSTDYVFDGEKKGPYVETDLCSPLSIYGTSKWQGEQAIQSEWSQHLIFRVQWLYGQHGTHFIQTLQTLLKNRDTLCIVADQKGSPTWTADIATLITTLIASPPSWGLYHLRSQGETTWYDYACFLKDIFDETCTISPQKTEEYPRPAKRPKNGILSTDKATRAGYSLPKWKDSVSAYVKMIYSRQKQKDR